MSHDKKFIHMHANVFYNRERNCVVGTTQEISQQEGSKMSKIIGELNARVRRKLFEEELQKNSSPEEQQNRNSSADALRNDGFYDNVVDQNETVAEFLDLCNNSNHSATTDNNNNITSNQIQNNSIDLTTSPTNKTENEIKKSVDVSFFALVLQCA